MKTIQAKLLFRSVGSRVVRIRACYVLHRSTEMNRFFIFAIAVLGISSFGSACIWTNTHCACTKKTSLLGDSNCYDLVADIPGSEKKKCSSRNCRESNEFVCDCDGASYCEHESENKSVLQHVGDNECVVVEKNITEVSLVAEDITKVHQTVPGKTRNCFFSDTECTCASTTEIGIPQDCVDFVYEDPQRGAVCRVRDCKESMQCDCGGSVRCSRAMKTTTVWRKVRNEGRPGFAICEQFESSAYLVTKIGDQPSELEAKEASNSSTPPKQSETTSQSPISEGNDDDGLEM